jgi:hypothetical protein
MIEQDFRTLKHIAFAISLIHDAVHVFHYRNCPATGTGSRQDEKRRPPHLFAYKNHHHEALLPSMLSTIINHR